MERCKRQRFLPYWERVNPESQAFPGAGREAAVSAGISGLGLLVFGGVFSGIGILREYSSFLVALCFLGIPVFVSRIWRRPWDVPSGLWRPSLRSATLLLVVSSLVFPLYGAGFHLWQKIIHQRSWCGEAERLLDWPDETMLALPEGAAQADVVAGLDSTGFWQLQATDRLKSPVRVQMGGDARFQVRSRGSIQWSEWRQAAGEGQDEALEAGQSLRIAHRAGEASIRLDGSDEVQVGRTGVEPMPWETKRDASWLLMFLLVHLLVVAIPEEFFYRGYLQGRLQMAFRRRLVWLGGDVGPAVWLTSAVFAAGHFLTVPSAFRLAVFFPSLLFGWLRDKTGTLWVPVIFHVLSNLVLELLSRMYC